VTEQNDSYRHISKCHSRWMLWETHDRRQIQNTDNTKIKYNTEKANNAK